LQLLEQACPHLVRELGRDQVRVCCAKAQLFDFLREFKLPQAVLVSDSALFIFPSNLNSFSFLLLL
jgi:hypothetical protein